MSDAYSQRLNTLLVPDDHIGLAFLGQAGFLFQTPTGFRVYLDLYLGNYPARIPPPLITSAEVQADLFLITHTHLDHLDDTLLPDVAKQLTEARFAGPPTVFRRLVELGIAPERIIEMPAGTEHTERDLTIATIPARHQEDTPDAVGYVLQTESGTFYHTGDTEYDPVLFAAKAYRPDVMMVPINGMMGNMSGEQAAQLTVEIAPKVVIPIHYGFFEGQPTEVLLPLFIKGLQNLEAGATPWLMEYGQISFYPPLDL